MKGPCSKIKRARSKKQELYNPIFRVVDKKSFLKTHLAYFSPKSNNPNMKKILVLLILVGLLLQNTFSQTTINNANMESWTNVGASNEEPQYWNSIKTAAGNSLAIGFAPQSCFRETTNPHAGTYCARIVTGSALSQAAPGSMTTGQVEVPSLTASEGYIQTVPGGPNFSMPFTGRPDSLVVWYRYTPQGSDYSSISALLHVGHAYLPETPVNGNHPDSSVNIIARAEWQGTNTTVSSWTRLAIPFVYVDNRIPQYILITLTSTANNGGTANSTLWVDDFGVIFNPTIATGTISPLSYYVSSTTGAAVNVPFTLSGAFNGGNTVTAQLSDASGSFVSPVTIGSLSTTTSGTINATIPANTPTGTGYRIRVISSNPALTAANNGSNISITLVGNSVAPSTTQNLAANTNGTLLAVTETPAATSREWKYSTTSGSGYTSFSAAQTGTTYTPSFPLAGTYYVVAVSTYPGGLNVISNEVQINVVANSISPTSTQSILVSTNGNTLTVAETPNGTSREWKYSTTSGSGYVSFGSPQTGSIYTPNFATAGNYYIVCVSVINGLNVTSNEVQISVNSVTLSTGTVNGSPFLFSPSAPAANISVPYTTSSAFTGGNIFTAQLSDANGSFAVATNIGNVTATTSGSVNASIPSNTPAGSGYRIRVVGSNPAVNGTDNGIDLVVDQFHNTVVPTTTQTIFHGVNGTVINVTASQNATHEWKYSTTSGSGYVSFSPAQTSNSYTPNFATPGTYYVVCVSTNIHSDAVTSNEVQINVTNGSTITTLAVSGSPYYISASATEQVTVNFTSDAVFSSGNVFTAQLSDFTGSFSNPVNIGSVMSDTVTSIAATIPNSSVNGNSYRIRVVSSTPALTGSDNGTNLQIIPFEISIAPLTTQNLFQDQPGSPISVTETQPATRVWMQTQTPGANYAPFSPTQTDTFCIPKFHLWGTYYVACRSTNSLNDVVTSQDVTVIVSQGSGIGENNNEVITAYWNKNVFVLNLTLSKMVSPVLQMLNSNGQVVLTEKLSSESVNSIAANLPSGIYIFNIADGKNTATGKTSKR
jgi:hypothetical protein